MPAGAYRSQYARTALGLRPEPGMNESENRKATEAEWRGRVSAMLEATQRDVKSLKTSLADHVRDDNDNFAKAGAARDKIEDKADANFAAVNTRIGVSELRLSIAGAIATLTLALVIPVGPQIIEWMGHDHQPAAQSAR